MSAEPRRRSEIVQKYLSALETADVPAVLALFAPGAIVNSPLYGTRTPEEFYPQLFADTSSSRLTLLSALEDVAGAPILSFWFRFDWVLADGTPAPFTVVDVAELAADGRIQRLHIIYDTASVREAFEAQQDRR